MPYPVSTGPSLPSRMQIGFETIREILEHRLHQDDIERLLEGLDETGKAELFYRITEMLRRAKVVGKFVEFFGEGAVALPVYDRATIANMAPEYGATCGIFPIDNEALNYLRLSGRSEEQIALVEQYAKLNGMFREPGQPEAEYTDVLHLDLGDVDLTRGEIAIRNTKFFKSRTLPLAPSVVEALRAFVGARHSAGGPQIESSGLFWHEQHAGRYSDTMAEKLLVKVMRSAGLKPSSGRVGPRIHDLRHSFVADRVLTWYREGINPQQRLPYLATYLGHKDIHSTLVYLTVTQELLQQASERFRDFGAHALHADAEVLS